METEESTIKFTFLRREFTGMVSKFRPAGRLMMRVYVKINLKGLPKEQVFIFYQLDNGKLFWYPHDNELKEDMAKSIAKCIKL